MKSVSDDAWEGIVDVYQKILPHECEIVQSEVWRVVADGIKGNLWPIVNTALCT